LKILNNARLASLVVWLIAGVTRRTQSSTTPRLTDFTEEPKAVTQVVSFLFFNNTMWRLYEQEQFYQ
jgi:hypothetical protein